MIHPSLLRDQRLFAEVGRLYLFVQMNAVEPAIVECIWRGALQQSSPTRTISDFQGTYLVVLSPVIPPEYATDTKLLAVVAYAN